MVKDRNILCKELGFAQLRPTTLQQVRFDLHEGEFDLLFEGYDPVKIRKNGSYLNQLNRVLKVFTPTSVSPYKKRTKAVYLSARYLSRFSSLDEFEKRVKDSTKDEKELYAFLDHFRLSSSLSSRYFHRSCLFFRTVGLLDIPVLSPKLKEVARRELSLPDDNEKLFFALLDLAKKQGKSCLDLEKELLSK